MRTPRSPCSARRTLKGDSTEKKKREKQSTCSQNPGSDASLACLYKGYELAFNKISLRTFFTIVVTHDLSIRLLSEIC